MAFIPVENTAHIRIEGRIDNQQTINDLYFRHTTGPIAAADLQALCVAIQVWVTDHLAPVLNEAWSGFAIHGRDLTTALGFVNDEPLIVAGGVTGEAAPNNCTMAVSFRTALSGRSNRGRNYVPCLTNSEVSGNNIDTTFINLVTSAYALLLFGGGALPAGWVWVVVSRFSGGLPRVAGVFNEVFAVIVTDGIVDSQRRRLPGRGK